jgi:DNA-binding beta-propeller fold protein YncE
MKSQKFLSLATLIFWVLALNFISLNVYADDLRNRADYMQDRGNDEHNRWDDERYVYTNDGQVKNTVTGFKVARNGSLTKIGRWRTGGKGCPHGLIATTRAITSEDGKLLFVSNGFYSSPTDPQCETSDATISVFRGASHGNLSPVGEPFSDPDHLPPGDTSVASFGNCLILGSSDGKKIISYKLPAMSYVSTSSMGAAITDMKVAKVGGKHYAAATLFDDKQVAMTRINSNTCELGAPTKIQTSGVGPDIYGGPAGLGFSPDGRKMYVGDANYDPIIEKGTTIVEVFDLRPLLTGGTPTPVDYSPYTYPSGDDSETVLVSKDGKCLFVANQFSATVTSVPLLNGVPGTFFTTNPVSIFTEDSPNLPIGLANDIHGKMLYVGIHPDNSVAQDNTVITELIGKDCALTGTPGGAVPTGVTSDLGFQTSIVASGDY